MQDYNLYLNTIKDMIGKIEDSIKKISKEKFLKNSELQDATLMRLQVIGENMKSVPFETKKENKEVKWKRFEKLRNIISHKYNSIDFDIVWDFIKNKIPELKLQIGAVK